MQSAIKQQPIERPGWIPEHITENWSMDPYAYVDREQGEYMSASSLHQYLCRFLGEMLEQLLQSHQRCIFSDVFMLYRDEDGSKQRIAPDVACVPFYDLVANRAYDLELLPTPDFVIEITSETTRDKDFARNIPLYVEKLAIPNYIIIDLLDDNGQERDEFMLKQWIRSPDGQAIPVALNANGARLTPYGLSIRVEGQGVFIFDEVRQERVSTLHETRELVLQERQRAEQAAIKAAQEKQRAEQAALKNAELTAEIERLRAELTKKS